MIKQRRTAYQTALLLVLNALNYGEAKNRSVSRYRIGAGVLRRLSNRVSLRESFLDAIRDELNELGWTMVVLPDGETYAVFKGSMAEKWAGLGLKRLKEDGCLDMTEAELEAAYSELTDPAELDLSDEED